MGDPIIASRLCQTIRSFNYQSRLLISHMHLDIETIKGLPMSLILVGDLANNNDLTEKYMTQPQKREFNHQVTHYPYAGKVVFRIGDCQTCWIKGGWNQKTTELVEDFIKNQDLINFLQNT